MHLLQSEKTIHKSKMFIAENYLFYLQHSFISLLRMIAIKFEDSCIECNCEHMDLRELIFSVGAFSTHL
jgi:hypothetical protein